MFKHPLFYLCATLLISLAARADEPSPPEPPTAIVPYDPALPVDAQKPSRMYLDYDSFQRLWKASKQTRTLAESREKTAIGERGATISSAMHSARVEGARLVAEARFSVLTRGPDWVVVPFAWSGASARTIMIDGSPAALREGQLIIEKPGLHSVVVDYEVPLPAGWSEAAWSIPAATATSLALKLAMDDPARPEINGGVPLVETATEGERIFTATLGRANQIVLRRQLSATRAGGVAGDPPLVTSRERLFVTSAIERLEASAEFTFKGEDRRSFSLRLDATLTPVAFDIPGLQTWTLRREAGVHHLDFELVAPVRDTFTARLVAERAVGALPATLSFPALSAAAGRTEREVSLLATDELDLRPQPNPQWHQSAAPPLTEEEAGGFAPVATFASSHGTSNLVYTLSARTVERLATTSYVFQVSPGKFEIIAGLQLQTAAGEDLLEATLRLPEGLTVQGVAGDRLADWWREADSLRLRFAGATPEVTTVTLNLTRSLAADDASISFTPLPIDGFAKIDGSGLLIAPLSTDTTLSFDQPNATVRETAPEFANRGFTVLLPFAIKRGFTFDAAEWTATVRLSPIAPQFDADWVLDAEVHEGFIALNANLLIRIRQGALNAVTFSLPASLPEMEVQGEDVREVTSLVDGDLRRYTVALQRETNKPLVFTLSGELGHSGRASLPDLDVPGATRIERFLIVENRSDGRLDLQRSGLTECLRGQLSFLPVELAESQKPAQFFRAQPGWSATAVLESLATTTGQAAVVLEADLTTSLLRNGEEWVRAVYRLHNRSLQFLPVALPKGAQLVSVMVADKPSRADVGVQNGVPVTLIPLIQTRPGERSVEVALVYRLHGPPPVRGVFKRTLDDPDLPGLSVQQTLWTVQLPKGFSIRHAKGPMTQIEAESLNVEKWLGRLAESASLISLSSSSGYDAKTREEALANSSQLLSELNNLESGQKFAGRETAAYTQVAEELSKQQSQISQNRIQAENEKAAAPSTADTRGRPLPFRKSFSENNIKLEAAEKADASTIQLDASQLAFNDNVFWKFETAPDATVVTDQPQGSQSQRRLNQLEKFSTQSGHQSRATDIQVVREFDEPNLNVPQPPELPQLASRPSSPDGASQLATAGDLNRYFSNSRINVAQNQAAIPATGPGQDPQPPIQSSTAGQPESPPSPPTQTTAPATDEQTARRKAPAPTATLSSHHALAEVFPAQDNTVHFKKIKDRATIQLVAAEPLLERHRLTQAGIFTSLIALIVLGDRWRLNRRRRVTATGALWV